MGNNDERRTNWLAGLLYDASGYVSITQYLYAPTCRSSSCKDGRIIASGYNGSVTGTPHCTEVGDLIVDGHCIRAVHAEQNALMQLAKMGIAADGAEIYVTDFPCVHCTKFLLQAGIKKINYIRNYNNDEFATSLIQAKGVALQQVPLTATDVAMINFDKYVTENN